MQFSDETLSILKNFGNINQGILFKAGNVLKTVNPHKTILAQVEIEETIPTDFGVYDLNNFLSVISLHKDTPSFEFDDKHVILVGNNNRSKIKYRFCEPTMIVLPPDKAINMPTTEVEFELTVDDFNWILRAASVLSSPHIAVESDGSKVYIVTTNMQDDSAHTDSLEICDGNGSSFKLIFKTENLTKILAGSYAVQISSQGVALFQNKNKNLKYWVSIEKGSFYKDQ